MKEINLTRGMVALVDDADYQSVSRFSWYATRNGDRWIAARDGSDYGKREIRLHRFILGLVDSPDVLVSFRDDDGLNCQGSNLLIVTRKQSNSRRRKASNKTSRYLGVIWNKERNRWQATIKSRFIGRFDCEIDAARAYDLKAQNMYKELARTNFPVGISDGR